MSSFANLFGKSTKVDENIEQLFKNTRDGPVSKDELVKKQRTVIKIPKVTAPKQQTNENESTSNQSADESDEEEDIMMKVTRVMTATMPNKLNLHLKMMMKMKTSKHNILTNC